MNYSQEHLNGREALDSVKRYKRLLIQLILFSSLLFLIAYSIINTFDGKVEFAVLQVTISIVFFFSIILLQYGKHLDLVYTLVSLCLLSLGVALIFDGGYHQNGLLYTYIFPVAFLFLWNLKIGIIWAIGYFAIVLVITLSVKTNLIAAGFESNELIQYVLSLALFTFIVHISQSFQQRQTRMLKGLSIRNANLASNAIRQKNQLSTILNSIGDGVIVLSKNKRIITINPVAEELSGFSASEVSEKLISEVLKFVGKDDEDIIDSIISQVLRTKKVVNMGGNSYLIQKNGERLPVGDSAAPIFNEKDEIVGIVIVFRDNSSERAVDEMKTEFVSLASHQLQTPLTEMKYMLELLKDKDLLEKDINQSELIEKSYSTAQAMSELVKDLLDVSRIESGVKFSIKKNDFDISNLITECIELNSITAKAKAVNIKYQEAKVPVFVNADRSKISEVISNLISNAIKYSNSDGEVIITLSQEDDAVSIGIQDYGIGIPKDQQSRVFSKLFRADNAKDSDISGTGLGLYIAKAIIDAHEGDIIFESELNKGTSFTIRLPI